MHTKKGYKRVFVARNCNRTTGLTAANLQEKLAYGEIVAVDEKGVLLNTAAKVNAAKAVRFIIGTRDGSPIHSDLIYKKDLISVESSKFKNRQTKKVIIGSDGTSGAIDVISGNVYAIEVDHIFNGAYTKESFSTRSSYEAKLTGETQFGIAQNLAKLLAYDYSIFDETVRVNVVTDAAGVAGATGCAVTHGSPSVTYTGGTPPTVGQAVIVTGITGADHRDEDDTVYKVIFVDTANNVFELDRPYQNRSQSGLTLNTIADTSVDNYGITLEGMDIKSNFREEYTVMDFDVRIFEFGDTPFLENTAALGLDSGFGRHEEVSNLEFVDGDGEGRNIYQTAEHQSPNINTDIGTGYSAITLRFDHMSNPNILDSHSVPKELTVFLQRGTYQDIHDDAAGTAFGTNIQTGTGLSGVDADSFLNVVNALAVNAGVLNAGVNTSANGGNEMTAGTTFSTGVDV